MEIKLCVSKHNVVKMLDVGHVSKDNLVNHECLTLTWSLCSATSSAKPLFGVGMTFARVAFLGFGSYLYTKVIA